MVLRFTKLVLALFVLVSLPVSVLAQTALSGNDLQTLVKQLEEKVKTLQTQVLNLQSELGAAKQELTEVKEELRITQILRRGASGEDVRKLQEFLKQFPEIYPEGLVTGYFGSLTETAVKRFQDKQGVVAVGSAETTGFGQVGPRTLSKINELIAQGAGASGVIPPGLLIAPGLTESAATSTQPTATTTTATTTTATTTPQSKKDLCAKDPKYCATEKECKAQNYHWYTVSCHSNPPPTYSCAASNNYCINPDECSKNGWYWCRNSCYSVVEACSGTTYVAPAQPAAVPTTVTSTTTTTTVSTPTPTTITATTTTTATSTSADITPPVISNVQVSNITQNSVTILWATNEASDSLTQYGASESYGQTSQNTSLVTSHSVNLTELNANTPYHYRVKSKDASGNEAVSSDYTFTTLAPVAAGCNSVDFEDDPYVGSNVTGNASHISWLNGKGIDITGSPSGYVWGTKHSGGAGQSGVTIGFASPNFSEQDEGISDDEVLTIRFLNELARTVSVTVASTPSSEPIINNKSSTVVMDAFDEAGTLLGSATKTFTGVTNGTYTPSSIGLSVSAAAIKKITLRASSHPYGGVWVEKVDFGTSCSIASGSLNPSLARNSAVNLANVLNSLLQTIENLKQLLR